jgi:hypothetical protein
MRYLTNNEAGDEGSRDFTESKRRTKICQSLFGQDNLIGLNDEQRDLFWETI